MKVQEHPGVPLDHRDVEARAFELESAQGTINRKVRKCRADCVIEVLSAHVARPDQHVREGCEGERPGVGDAGGRREDLLRLTQGCVRVPGPTQSRAVVRFW